MSESAPILSVLLRTDVISTRNGKNILCLEMCKAYDRSKRRRIALDEDCMDIHNKEEVKKLIDCVDSLRFDAREKRKRVSQWLADVYNKIAPEKWGEVLWGHPTPCHLIPKMLEKGDVLTPAQRQACQQIYEVDPIFADWRRKDKQTALRDERTMHAELGTTPPLDPSKSDAKPNGSKPRKTVSKKKLQSRGLIPRRKGRAPAGTVWCYGKGVYVCEGRGVDENGETR